jgi:hypothetical protein
VPHFKHPRSNDLFHSLLLLLGSKVVGKGLNSSVDLQELLKRDSSLIPIIGRPAKIKNERSYTSIRVYPFRLQLLPFPY